MRRVAQRRQKLRGMRIGSTAALGREGRHPHVGPLLAQPLRKRGEQERRGVVARVEPVPDQGQPGAGRKGGRERGLAGAGWRAHPARGCGDRLDLRLELRTRHHARQRGRRELGGIEDCRRRGDGLDGGHGG